MMGLECIKNVVQRQNASGPEAKKWRNRPKKWAKKNGEIGRKNVNKYFRYMHQFPTKEPAAPGKNLNTVDEGEA